MKYITLNKKRRVISMSDSAPTTILSRIAVEVDDPTYEVVAARWPQTPTFITDDGEVVDGSPVPNPVPDPVVPNEVPVWRLRVVAEQASLTGPIQTVLDSLPEPNKSVANEIWNRGNTIRRDSSIAQGIIQALELTEEQADDLFVQAASLPT